ncbi:MAG: tetratricopeptide repeat protein [Deltaproteobacteria bacterium]|nr:tetratricopeptide repeat protein [Deltaproteobacteria bacterium]
MVGLVLKCEVCGFENPRGWVCCARCDQLLGPTHSDSRKTSTTNSITRKVAPPAQSEPRKKRPTRPPSSPYIIDGTKTSHAIIGQDSAVQAIQQGLRTAFNRRGATLTALQGTRGSGKTRLLIHASELAAKQYDKVRLLYAVCRPSDDGPYAPFSRLLLERFGVTPSSSPSTVRAEMAVVIGETLKSTDAPLVSETTHLLGHMAGVPFPDSPILKSLSHEPAELHARSIQAARRFLEGNARDHLLLIMLDEMEKAENEAWDLLDALLESQSPIAVIAAGGESILERTRKLAHRSWVIESEIIPFSKDEIAQVVKLFVPELNTLPEPFIAALSHRSQGNPGAIHDLIEGLFEGGLFIESKTGLEVDLQKIEMGVLSLTTEDIIRSRRDALEAYEREVVERAVVVGEIFWDGAVLAMQRSENSLVEHPAEPLDVWPNDDDEAKLSDALNSLEEKGFVVCIERTNIPGRNEYTFQHAGTRSVIYSDLPEAIRVKRHAVIARFLSVTPGLRPEGIDAVIAPHLERAGRKAEAGRAFFNAAEEQGRRLRTTMALRLIERALSLIEPEDLTYRIDAMHKYGSLLVMLGRYDEAESAFREILQLAYTLGARGKGGASFNRIARIYRARGVHEKALKYLQRALRLFREANDQRGVSSTLDDMAQVYRSQGNLDAALAAANEALDNRISEKDERGQALSLNTIGNIMLDRGDFTSAQTRLKAALEIRSSIDDHEGVVQTRIGLGKLAYFQEQYDDAIENHQIALERAREMANNHSQAILLNLLGEAFLAKGAFLEAETAFNEAKEIAERIADQATLVEVECNFGLLALRTHKTNAKDLLENAFQMSVKFGTREALARAHRAIGRLRAQTLFDDGGKMDNNAESSFRESIKIFENSGNRHELARTLAELGYHLIERGQRNAARQALQTAYQTMGELKLLDQRKLEETLAEL